MSRSYTFKQQAAEHALQLDGRAVPYGMGCAWVGKLPEDQAVQTLHAAYDAGYRYFDTSEAYGDSEHWVGRFVEQVDRPNIFLATKSHVRGDTPEESAAHVRQNLRRSLERLRTDRLDLFQVHDVQSLKHTFAKGGVLDVLRDAKAQGLIRYCGLATRFHVLLEQATLRGALDTVLTYNDYTPIDDCARMLIGLASKRGKGVINASPLASGLLTGQDPRELPAGQRDPRRCELAVRFGELCRQYDLTPMAAALQYPLKQWRIDMNLTGPATPEQVRAGIEAIRTPIPKQFWAEWRQLRQQTDVALQRAD